MPALEALSFSLEQDRKEFEFGHYFCQAPSLQTATFYSPSALSQSKPMWACLHTLVVDMSRSSSSTLSVSHTKEVLSQCKSLQTLSWNAGLRRKNTNRVDEHPIVLPITTLIGGLEVDDLPHVLLPNLHDFDLEVLTPMDATTKALSVSQERYRSLITKLSVCESDLDTYRYGRPLLRFGHSTRTTFSQLGNFPELHTLRLTHSASRASKSTFTKIPPRFPKLKTLSYTIWADADSLSIFDNVVNLVKAFQRRTDGADGLSQQKVSVLEKVELNFPYCHLSREQLLALRDIQESGLSLEVRDAHGDLLMLADVS